MLTSVGVGVVLIYPTLFLSDFPTGGFSGLPHHVWTSHKPFENSVDRAYDLEIRQIWIHGSYMQALKKQVLENAMKLQNSILAGAIELTGVTSSQTELEWGFHSPLMYWNNSLELLHDDSDVLRTVNEQVCQPSFLNATLRPQSVFAGKTFSGSVLTAADALVISLFNRRDDEMGNAWQRNIVNLASRSADAPLLYQTSGAPSRSQLYEYRFQPLSFRQNSALAIAYGTIAIYVAVSLRRLKAFHSRFGLVVTALTQMTTSVLASFTICGLLKINLAQIPQEAYPFVVLVIGLENIFRLINAVLAYPPEMPNTQRIANGIGDIGHASVASAAQNLLILWLLSLVVSPGVTAFCAFAAVALLFDYFFLLTFFVAVLNVDIRRLELQDSISRGGSSHAHSQAHTRAKRKTSPERHTWVDALIQGRIPFSTRMAGSAVTISFVMVLNWHLTDHSHPASPFRAFPGLFEKQGLPLTNFDGTSPPPMNQTTHPSHWLRTQDYENAVHFMNVVKPGSNGFIAKIFDPLVIVLAGSDRSEVPLQKRSVLTVLRKIAVHHFYPSALVVVFVVAFVTVLMNFLLWDDRAEDEELENSNNDDAPLAVSAISTGHRLDVIKIAGCRQGHILSIGLDRSVSILLFDYPTSTYHQVVLASESADRVIWPVHVCTISDDGQWMALLCDGGQVLLGNLIRGELTHTFQMECEDSTPLVFSFIPKASSPTKNGAFFVAITPDGVLTEYGTYSGSVQTYALSSGELLAASLGLITDSVPEIIVQRLDGLVSTHRRTSGTWHMHESSLPIKDSFSASPRLSSSSLGFLRVPELEISLVCAPGRLTWLHSASTTTTPSGVMYTESARPSSVRVLYSGLSQCMRCNSPTVTSISFAYINSDTKDAIIQTLASQGDDTPQAMNLFQAPENCDCMGNLHVEKTAHRLQDPGSWESTTEAIVGLRRHPEPPASPPTLAPPSSPPIAPQTNLLRRRRNTAVSQSSSTDDGAEHWEAYLLSSSGDLHTVAIDTSSVDQLYATRAGPACKLGSRSVAIALGSTIYVIRVSGDRAEKTGVNGLADGIGFGNRSGPGRRRNTGRKAI
ncbi:hypothetical protein MBLNU459_g6959t1 [Dothideomycetes sp. NU459]